MGKAKKVDGRKLVVLSGKTKGTPCRIRDALCLGGCAARRRLFVGEESVERAGVECVPGTV